ncbi:MAG: hypothetical protein MUQ56_03785, partial [Thermoleophilia bacterium]|nr:hypothetical protein [Thermoleophilia bacterium]
MRLTSPDTGTTLFRYDAAGSLLEKIEDFGAGHLNRSTRYEYDGLDRLTRVDLPNDPDWIFSYDTDASKNQKGRLAQVTNGVVTTAFDYTDRGQVARERTTIDGKSYDVLTSYDGAGNVRTLRSPGNVITTTDHAGARPKTVQIAAGPSTETIRNLEFWPFGPRTRAELPPYDTTYPAGNRVISAREYNARGQVSEIDVTGPSGLNALDLSYTYPLQGPGPAPNDPGPNLDQV